MKSIVKSFLLLNLFGAVLSAATAFANEESGCLKLMEQTSEYDAVAKGEPMTWQIKLRTDNCHLLMQPPSVETSPQIVPPAFNLHVSESGYDKIRKPEGGSTAHTADELDLTVLITPDAGVAPGEYQVPVVLRYESLDNKGNQVQETTPLVVPVKVVTSKNQVHVKKHPWHTVATVALVIVLVPVVIAAGIFQMVTGIEIFPDC